MAVTAEQSWHIFPPKALVYKIICNVLELAHEMKPLYYSSHRTLFFLLMWSRFYPYSVNLKTNDCLILVEELIFAGSGEEIDSINTFTAYTNFIHR